MSPKRLLAALAATAALAAAIPAGAAQAAPVPAQQADSFVESIGVNTHLGYNDTPYYTQFGTVEQRLRELGVHHIRDGLMPGRPDEYANLDALGAAGIHSTLIMGSPAEGSTGLGELVSTLKTQLGPSVEAVEGPNEYDTSGDPSWASNLSAYQSQLYSAIKSDPATAGLPVIGPSVVQKRNEEALGNISGSLDAGNVHSYPMGEEPEANVPSYLQRAALNAPGKPVVATETGYHNALGWTGEQAPVSEAAAAIYMPRLFLDYFGAGVSRTFAYELVDEGTDQSQREQNWGLLRNDLSPKPAFTALQNLIAIVSDPGAGFTPEALDYTTGGDTTGLHQVLLARHDGTYDLALWREASVWDAAARTPITVPSTPVTLSFERTIDGVTRYEPTVSPSPLAGGTRTNSEGALALNVGAGVTILHLDLGAVPTGRIHLWAAKRSVPAGGRVAIGGSLPQAAAGLRLAVDIQRWSPEAHRWHTVGRGHTTRLGKFHKAIRAPRRFGQVSRLRVVAAAGQPSKPIRLHVRRAARV